jgi:hypothetical protein
MEPGAMTTAVPPNSGNDAPEPRAEPRRRALLSGMIVHSAAQMSVPCTILDISRTGARVRLVGADFIGEPLYLINLSHALAFRARTVWRRADRMGLNFVIYYDLSKAAGDAPPILRRLWVSHISSGPSS